MTFLIGVDSCPGFTGKDVFEMLGETDSNKTQLHLLASRLAEYQTSTALKNV